MASEGTDGSGGWPRGALLLLAVLEVGVLVPAACFLALWAEPGWATAAAVTAVMVVWAVVIAYLRTGPEGAGPALFRSHCSSPPSGA